MTLFLMDIKPIFGEINPNVDERLCFVLMPFTKKLSELFEDSIKKIVISNQLDCLRADDIYDVRPIMSDIWDSICKARIIISDLTDKNPNVFYETGIAHTLGKTTILLTQSMKDVPFDLRHLRIIVYEFTPRGVQKLENDLDTMIKSLLSKEGDQLHIQSKEITKSSIEKDESINLWDETGIKPASENYLVYKIPVRKGFDLVGTISSNDVFSIRLVNEKNKEKFENRLVSESIFSSINNLRYDIHQKIIEDEKLYLMLSTKFEKRSEFKIQLKLVKTVESKTKIMWSELGYLPADSSEIQVHYNVKCDEGDTVNIDISSENKCDFHILDSENYTSLTRKNGYQSSTSELNSNSMKLDFQCPKKDTWYIVVIRKSDEYMKLETMIKLIKK